MGPLPISLQKGEGENANLQGTLASAFIKLLLNQTKINISNIPEADFKTQFISVLL